MVQEELWQSGREDESNAGEKLPVGIENFEEIRKEGFYYIDKTGLIRDLLNNWGKVNLFTRPRRFGKTLNMSMLKCFFEIGAVKNLFDGLAISQETAMCEEYMGKYPVIFISLKGVDGLNFEEARKCMIEVVGKEAESFQFLRDSECLSASFCAAFPAGDVSTIQDMPHDYLWDSISVRNTAVWGRHLSCQTPMNS